MAKGLPTFCVVSCANRCEPCWLNWMLTTFSFVCGSTPAFALVRLSP